VIAVLPALALALLAGAALLTRPARPPERGYWPFEGWR
jgi:hypothetical protein